MKYRVIHTTRYEYPDLVHLCHNQLCLGPKMLAWQQVLNHSIKIVPEPDYKTTRIDFFGNNIIHFSVQKPHQEMEVKMEGTMELNIPPFQPLDTRKSPSWNLTVDFLKSRSATPEVRQYVLETELTISIPAIRQYAEQSFTPNRPLLEAAQELNERINHDFEFTPGFTDVSTPVDQVFIHKKGVCQDFAHFFLSCLRSLGLAARYVSGYLETIPPPGQPKLAGADASHAWVSVFDPEIGWVDFDSTNNLVINTQHITIAWGRDFNDIIPMKGIIYSSGEQKLGVSVDVARIE